MKREKKAVIAAVCAALFLAACGGQPEVGVTSEEIVVPEMSSEELLVSSLEYLLEEEDGDTGEENTGQEDQVVSEADDSGQQPEESEPELVTATVVHYGASGRKEETVTIEETMPEALIGELARHNIVPLLDTKVLSVEEQEEDGVKVLYLDLSGSFREYLLTMSEEAECNIIASVASTFLPNYDAQAMYIMVKGEPLVTSHAEYTQPIYDDTPEEIRRFMISADGEEDTAGQKEQDDMQ